MPQAFFGMWGNFFSFSSLRGNKVDTFTALSLPGHKCHLSFPLCTSSPNFLPPPPFPGLIVITTALVPAKTFFWHWTPPPPSSSSSFSCLYRSEEFVKASKREDRMGRRGIEEEKNTQKI